MTKQRKVVLSFGVMIVVAVGWSVLAATIGLPAIVALLGGVCLGGTTMFGLLFWQNR